MSQRATFACLRNSGTPSSPPLATYSPSSLSFPTLSNLSPPHHFPPLYPFTDHVRHQHSPLFYLSPLRRLRIAEKRRHEKLFEHDYDSRPTASTGPMVICRGPSSPLVVHSLTPVIPQRIRLNLAIDTTLSFMGATIRTASFSAMTPPVARTMRTSPILLPASRAPKRSYCGSILSVRAEGSSHRD